MKTEKEIRERISMLECAHEEEYLDEGEQAELAILKWVVGDGEY